MGNKDFIKGMEAGAKPFEQKFEELSEDTKKVGERIDRKLDGLGEIMDTVIDDLSDMQKRELYNLNTPYDLKEDLDTDEKEILAALLLRLSGFTENNEYQKKFIRSVNTYIEVKTPQAGLDISCIEKIENVSSQKIMMQTAMEYLYLANEDFSFLDDLEEEVFEHFSVNRKSIREIEGYIEAVSNAVGNEGIAEKYGFVPEEETENEKIDVESFRLYKEATPYDLLEDLSEKDLVELCTVLSMLIKETEPNGLQRKYIDVMKSEAELDVESVKGKEPDIDSMEMKAQRIILQVAMEYGYLGSGSFDFTENELFDDFSVNKRGIRQIKDIIQKVCDEKGLEGIIEKYQYMGVDEAAYYQGEKITEEAPEKQFFEYDGSDISEACADQVNIHHHYIVLRDYLVYCNENFSETKIFCVNKQSGEKKEIPVDIENRDEIKACNLCGYGSRIYLLHDSGIYSSDVDSDNLHMQKMNVIGFKSHAGSNKQSYAPQCNQNFLVYTRRKREYEDEYLLVVINLKNENAQELLLTGKQAYRLHNDTVYCVDQNSNYEKTLIQYDIATERLEIIADNVEDDGFLCENEYYNSTTCEYGKYIFCAKDNVFSVLESSESYYSCINTETNEFSISQISDIPVNAFFVAYHYIYCLLNDSGIERYDILTGAREKIVGNTKTLSSYEEGFFRKTSVSFINKMETQLQVIGNWIYYKEPYEYDVHKILIDRKKDIVLEIER